MTATNTSDALAALPEEVRAIVQERAPNDPAEQARIAASVARSFAPPPPPPGSVALPGGLTRDQFAELHRANPYAASNYLATHNVTPAHFTDPKPAAPAPDPSEVMPGGATRGYLDELRRTNPFALGQFIGSLDKQTERELRQRYAGLT